MKAERLLKALGDIDDELIEEAYINKSKSLPAKWTLAAAGIALAAVSATVLAKTAGIPILQPEVTTDPYSTVPNVPPVTFTETPPAAVTEAPYTQTAVSEEVPEDGDNEKGFAFGNVTFFEGPSTGNIPRTYEELLVYIEKFANKFNFVRFEIVERYTAEEAAIIADGLENTDFYAGQQTLFRARIEYDYLHGEAADKEIYILKAGNDKIQVEDHPLYNVGDKYVTMFTDLNYSSTNSPLPELTFACIGDCLYKLGFEEIKLFGSGGGQLGTELSEEEALRYTSTSNNPERYVRKFTEQELSEFMCNERDERGYSSPNLDSSVFDTSVYEFTDDGDVIPIG